MEELTRAQERTLEQVCAGVLDRGALYVRPRGSGSIVAARNLARRGLLALHRRGYVPTAAGAARYEGRGDTALDSRVD